MKNTFGIPSLIATSIVYLLLSACGDNQSGGANIEDYLKVSRNYQDQGQFRAAIIEAQNAIQKAPDNSQGFKRLAQIYNELGAGKKASDLLLKLPQLEDPELVFVLHEAYLQQKKYQSANALLEQYPALEETHAEEYYVALAATQAGLDNSKAAAAAYQQALNIKPNSSTATLGLAKLDIQQGDLDAASSLLKEIAEDDKNITASSLLKSDIAYARGKLNEAEENLNKALFTLKETDLPTPQRVNTLRKLIEVLTQQGRSNEAYIYSKSLAEANPLGHELNQKFQLAINKYKNGELEAAEELLLDIHKKSAGSAMSGQMLGMINYLQGDISAAEGLLSEHVDTETASTETRLLLASAQIRSNKPDQALQVLAQDAASSNAKAEVLAMYGLAALQTGDSNTGIDYIQAALKKKPDNTELRLALAQHYAAANKMSKALTELRTAFEKKPEDTNIQAALIETLLATNALQEAQKVSKQIREDYAQVSTSFSLAGHVAFANDDLNSAQKYFAKAQKLDSKNISSLYGLAKIEFSRKRWQVAEQYFKEITRQDPTEMNALRGILLTNAANATPQRGIDYLQKLPAELFTPKLVLAERYIELNNFQAALAQLKRAQNIKPESRYAAELNARALLGQSEALLATGELPAARAHILQALQIAPMSLRLLQQLARVDIAGQQTLEVEKTLARMNELAPNDALVHELRGDFARAQDDEERAINSYRLAWNEAELDSSAGKLYQLLSSSQPRQAQEFLQQWQSTTPDSPVLLTLMAQQKESVGDKRGAIKMYNKALKVAPNSPGVMNNLAWLYHADGDKRGLKLAQQAYQIAPGSAAIADTYGWILANNGEKDKAIEVLEYAVSLAPGVKEIEEHLAKAKAL